MSEAIRQAIRAAYKATR
ncbi:hypothetical protein K7W41_18375 [Deinococcus multiflagellatus]|nr:hypothetical protein [Deinococcus multiflagellatus]